MMYILPKELAGKQHLHSSQSSGVFPVVLEWAGSGAPAVSDNKVFYLRTFARTKRCNKLVVAMQSLQDQLKCLNNCRHACQVRVSLGHDGPDLTASCPHMLLGSQVLDCRLQQAWEQFSKLQKNYLLSQKHCMSYASKITKHDLPVVLAVSLYPEAVLALNFMQTPRMGFNQRAARKLIRTCQGASKSTAVYLALQDVLLGLDRAIIPNTKHVYAASAPNDIAGLSDSDFDPAVTSQVATELLKCKQDDVQALVNIPKEFQQSVWFVQSMCKLLGKYNLIIMKCTNFHIRLSKEFRRERIRHMNQGVQAKADPELKVFAAVGMSRATEQH
jgi:hypothetical protein